MGNTLGSILGNAERLAALRKTGLLDSAPEEAFDRLTRLASKIIGAPVSLVSLVDVDRQFFKSVQGLKEPWASKRETPLSHSFCQHAVNSGLDLIIEDARIHPLVKESRAIPELGAVAYAGIPLIDDDGNALGSFCVIDSKPREWTQDEIEILRELASSVMTEVRLRSMVVGLQEIDRMRAELIAVISHDLRNPLTAIIGSVELLMSESRNISPEDANDFLKMIHEQGKRMLQMVEEMLARSRADADAGRMKHESVDLAPLLGRVIKSFQVGGHTNPLEVEAPSRLVIRADEGMIEQVMTNLIDNACKYSDPRSPVSVRLAERDQHAVFEVSDKGIGIDEGLIATVFQPFQQVNGNQDISGGVGLGLHIVRRFIEMHEGTIDVSSQKGEGSIFSVTLPAS